MSLYDYNADKISSHESPLSVQDFVSTLKLRQLKIRQISLKIFIKPFRTLHGASDPY